MCFYYFSDSDSEFDDECTLSASEILSSTQGEDMEITYTDDCGSIEVLLQYGPETREEWRKRLTAALKEKFNQINTVEKQSDENEKYFNQDRVVVDVDIILNMFQVCQLKTCLANSQKR